MKEQVELAQRIAREAHKGQTRWDKSTPYISHPAAVAKMVRHLGHFYEATAWLHDVLEDTYVTYRDLLDQGVDPVVLAAIVLLTQKRSDDYLEYILLVKAHPITRHVKVADIEHNMGCFDKPRGSLYQKYQLALYILKDM